MTDYTPTEMMTDRGGARAAERRRLLRRHRHAVGRLQSRAADACAGHHADLRIRHDRHQADVLPLSIGDGELCETALTTVSVPEMFRYWLQGGRITVGFLGGAQIDKFANLNTTVVGPYDKPKVRLPGGGGAPEIATIAARSSSSWRRASAAFVDKLDFITSLGHGEGGDSREQLGVKTKGPTKLITDLCDLRAGPGDQGNDGVSIHPGVTREQIQENTGWTVQFADKVGETPPPTARNSRCCANLQARTDARAWRGGVMEDA